MTTTAAPDLLRGAAHLLRTPLGVILGMGTTLRDYGGRFTAEQQSVYLGEIVSAAEELRAALDGLTAYARVAGGRVRFAPAAVPLAAAVRIAEETLADAWGAAPAGGETRPLGSVSVDIDRLAETLAALAQAGAPAEDCVVGAEAGALRIGPLRTVLPPADVERLLGATAAADEAGEWLARPGGWPLLLARLLAEGQGARLTATPTASETVTLVLHCAG